MDFSTKPWWLTDTYDKEEPMGQLFDDANKTPFGPNGPALVKLWNDGTTSKGWGSEEFMARYMKKEFEPRRILHGYRYKKWNFAFIMRSLQYICIDIDGKNGGFDHVGELGFLPPTAAETSKSGNGYHLFYQVDDNWDLKEGFSSYRDHIGIVTGVDVRGVGCVYHYPSQRWNHRKPAMIPFYLKQKLLQKVQQQRLQAANIQKVLELDKEEIAMMHAELIDELDKPIADGKRNNTLFAIGSKMKQAQVPNWDVLVGDRATQVGLDDDEIDKLISNINSYA